MTNYRFSLIFTLIFIAFFCSCSNTGAKVDQPLSNAAQLDSIKNDEINHPIDHNYLSLAQRAVIRPIYVETERNIKATHKGYLIHIKLKNEAQFITYKDIKVEISYFSDKDVALDKEEIVIKKAIKPGQSLQLSNKVKQYKNTSYKVKLVSATAQVK
jgi:hypothetical protein